MLRVFIAVFLLKGRKLFTGSEELWPNVTIFSLLGVSASGPRSRIRLVTRASDVHDLLDSTPPSTRARTHTHPRNKAASTTIAKSGELISSPPPPPALAGATVLQPARRRNG